MSTTTNTSNTEDFAVVVPETIVQPKQELINNPLDFELMNNKMYCGECKDFHYGPPDKIQRMIFNCSRRAKQLSNEKLKAAHNELRYMKLLTKPGNRSKKRRKRNNLI